MSKPSGVHVAVYGNTRILRAYCSRCEGYAFILRSRMACCGSMPAEPPEGFKVIVEPHRRHPSPAKRAAILDEQRGLCLYCENSFGTAVLRGGKGIVLRVVWDHFAPFSVFGDTTDENFVAACQVCNQFKGARIFQTVAEAADWLRRRWGKEGIEVL